MIIYPKPYSIYFRGTIGLGVKDCGVKSFAERLEGSVDT